MKSFFLNFSSLIVVISSFVVACSKVNFEKDKAAQPPGCIANQDKGCDFDYDIFINGGMVDILFVVDNSGSMSIDQEKMGQRFPNLIKQLDDRMLDYRIGIITTDISNADNPAAKVNQDGALQDGKLIEFKSGMRYLEPNIADKNTLFLNTIHRDESIACDQFLQNALINHLDIESNDYIKSYNEVCPSDDERAIAAAYKLVNNNKEDFLRKEAHLAVVIISDEDNRSWGIDDGTSKYTLAPADRPQNFIDLVKLKYGDKKSLAAHSIVVPTGDTICLNTQNSQIGNLVRGYYGSSYEKLSELTGGVKGSICAPDYGEQMGKIGTAIVKQVETFDLHCANPINLKVTVSPASAANSYTIEGKRLHFTQALAPSSRANFKYSCP